jgi:phosphatidate cytidylyltransferase
MLQQRIVSGCLLAALVFFAAFRLPIIAILPLLLLVAALAQSEFYRLLDTLGIPAFRVVGTAAGAALLTVTFLALTLPDSFSLPRAADLAADMEIATLFLVVFAICLRQFPQKHNRQPLATISCTIFGVLYVPFLFNYITKILFHWEHPNGWLGPLSVTGRSLALYLIVVVKMTDIGAYAVGRLAGRHKMIPRVSPGKTWEGLLGGLAAGTAASLAYFLLFRTSPAGGLGILRFAWSDALILGLILSGVGVLGDLVESLMKRAGGAKDSGTVVPGMGGMLDLIDSLLLTAPCCYYYLRLIT